jgi:tight adherence protein B
MGAVIFMFIVGVGAVMGAYYAFTMLPGLMQQRRLENRLVEVTSLAQADDKAGAAGLVKEQKGGLLPILDRLASATARGSALSGWLEQTGTKVSVSSLIVMSLASAVIVGFLATVITRIPLAMIAGGIIGAAIPPLILNIKRTRRMRRFEETFPEALDLMARALKAGHAFATGLKMVADEMDEPVGPEFRKTFDEQNFGLPMKDALQNLTERVPLIDVRFFATAVLIQRETGGNLAEILENLAHVVRERFKILRQVRVYTAHGRLTGWVLLALPAFLAVALAFINPDHMQVLFRERMGQMMLIGAGVMQTIGYFWIKQVIKIEV